MSSKVPAVRFNLIDGKHIYKGSRVGVYAIEHGYEKKHAAIRAKERTRRMCVGEERHNEGRCMPHLAHDSVVLRAHRTVVLFTRGVNKQ